MKHIRLTNVKHEILHKLGEGEEEVNHILRRICTKTSQIMVFVFALRDIEKIHRLFSYSPVFFIMLLLICIFILYIIDEKIQNYISSPKGVNADYLKWINVSISKLLDYLQYISGAFLHEIFVGYTDDLNWKYEYSANIMFFVICVIWSVKLLSREYPFHKNNDEKKSSIIEKIACKVLQTLIFVSAFHDAEMIKRNREIYIEAICMIFCLVCLGFYEIQSYIYKIGEDDVRNQSTVFKKEQQQHHPVEAYKRVHFWSSQKEVIQSIIDYTQYIIGVLIHEIFEGNLEDLSWNLHYSFYVLLFLVFVEFIIITLMNPELYGGEKFLMKTNLSEFMPNSNGDNQLTTSLLPISSSLINTPIKRKEEGFVTFVHSILHVYLFMFAFQDARIFHKLGMDLKIVILLISGVLMILYTLQVYLEVTRKFKIVMPGLYLMTRKTIAILIEYFQYFACSFLNEVFQSSLFDVTWSPWDTFGFFYCSSFLFGFMLTFYQINRNK